MTETTVQASFLFVGQRPSKRAEQIGATWQNGKLAACTLWRALEALQLDPAEQTFINIWLRAEPCSAADEAESERTAREFIGASVRHGATVIGMGAVVHRWLAGQGIPFTKLTHPAARGALRRRERYERHVAEVLGPLLRAGGREREVPR